MGWGGGSGGGGGGTFVTGFSTTSIESGGAWTLDTTVLAMEPGPVNVTVNVYYTDDLNQTRVFSQVLTVDVMGIPTVMEDREGGNGFPGEQAVKPPSFWDLILRFIKGLLGLGS